MKKILLTGSSGFIGAHVGNYLHTQGYTVIGVDKKQSDTAINYEFIQHDLTESCQGLPEVDIVLHLAAFNGTKYFYTHPFDVIKQNIISTINLIDRYQGKIERFVYAGSPESTAGATDLFDYPIPTDENCPFVIADPTNPRWSYAGSKALSEQATIASGIPYTVIRYNNIFGPGQVDHFISEFYDRVQQGVYELYGWKNTRTFMYISDAVVATTKLIQSQAATNQIVNVGGTQEVSILEVAEFILENLGIIDQHIVCYESAAGSANRRCPDVSKLKELVNFQEQLTWQQGIDLTLKELKCK
jgi:nucleoside-diphosphate-sugar epimerase